nr:GAF domain-containing protein [Chloroflexaceae bacterium]
MMNADEHDFWLPVGEPTEREAELDLPPADPTPPPVAEVSHAAVPEVTLPDETSAQLTSLLQVSAYLVAVRNPDELIPHLVSQVVETLPSVQAGILWLYDRRNNRLRIASTHGLPLDPQTLASLHQFSCSPSEGGLAGVALLQTGPMLRETAHGYRNLTGRNSTREHAIFQRLHEQLPRTLTVVAVPLRVGNETNGVLELLNLGPQPEHADWRPLRSCNLPVLHTFGTLAAAALKNTQLYAEAESHRQRLNAFDAVVTAISTATDLHDMVGSVLDV